MATSSDRVVDALRSDILSGRHAAGQRLGEVELAGELGTSRTPVREALRRLSAEGLVELTANRGARVAEPSAADLDAVFVLRAHAEGVAARTAALNASPDDVAELGRLARAVATAARPGDGAPDLDAVYRYNREFHDLLLALAGSASLTAVVGGLVHSTILMRTYRAFDADAMHRSVEHHLELVAAVQAGDPDWAESVMRSHLYSARAALLGSRRAADAPRREPHVEQHRQQHPEEHPARPTGVPRHGDLTAEESA